MHLYENWVFLKAEFHCFCIVGRKGHSYATLKAEKGIKRSFRSIPVIPTRRPADIQFKIYLGMKNECVTLVVKLKREESHFD